MSRLIRGYAKKVSAAFNPVMGHEQMQSRGFSGLLDQDITERNGVVRVMACGGVSDPERGPLKEETISGKTKSEVSTDSKDELLSNKEKHFRFSESTVRALGGRQVRLADERSCVDLLNRLLADVDDVERDLSVEVVFRSGFIHAGTSKEPVTALSPVGCGAASCLQCGRSGCVEATGEMALWKSSQQLMGAHTCVKMKFNDFVQVMFTDRAEEPFMGSAIPFFENGGLMRFGLPRWVVSSPTAVWRGKEFLEYCDLSDRCDPLHLFPYHVSMVQAIDSSEYCFKNDLRWLAIEAGFIEWNEFHTLTDYGVISRVLCCAAALRRSDLKWLPWFDVVFFVVALLSSRRSLGTFAELATCVVHGGRFAFVDMLGFQIGECGVSCFRVPEKCVEVQKSKIVATGDAPVTTQLTAEGKTFMNYWEQRRLAEPAMLGATPMEPPSWAYVRPVGAPSVFSNSGSSSSSSSSSSASGSSSVQDTQEEEEENTDEGEGIRVEAGDDFESCFRAIAHSGGAIPEALKSVSGFVKKKYQSFTSVVGVVEFITGCYEKIKNTLVGLGLTKRMLYQAFGVVVAVLVCMLVKRLVRALVPVREVIESLCIATGDNLGEFPNAVRKAFEMFPDGKELGVDVLDVKQVDGKYVFSSKKKKEENKTPLDVKATSAQLIAAILGGAVSTTLPTKKSLSERVVEGVKLIVPLVTVAGVSAQAVFWIFSKLPDSCGELLQKWVGINPATRGNARMYDLLSRGGAMTIHFRDAKPEDITIAEARAYLQIHADILCLLMDASVQAGAAAAGRSLLAEMKGFVELAKVRLGENESRVTPVGLYFFGKPGIGKSTLMPLLAKELFPDRAAGERFYTKNMDSEYWEGFRPGTPMVYFDEPHAASGISVEKFNVSILSLISSASCTLNYAGMSDKGKVKFTCQVVAMSSNLDPSGTLKGLASVSAFRRRMMYWEVVLLPEFATDAGLIDEKKMNDLTDADRASLVHLRFLLHEVYDLRTGTSRVTGQYCLEQMATIIRAKMYQNEISFDNIQRALVDDHLRAQSLPASQAVSREILSRMDQRRNVVATAGDEDEKRCFTRDDDIPAKYALSYFSPVPSAPLEVGLDGSVHFCAPLLEEFVRKQYPDWSHGLVAWSKMLPSLLYNSVVCRKYGMMCLSFGDRLFGIAREDGVKVVRMAVQALESRDERGPLVGNLCIKVVARHFRQALVNIPWFKEAIERAQQFDQVKYGVRFEVGDAWMASDAQEELPPDSVVSLLLKTFGLKRNLKFATIEPWMQMLVDAHTKLLADEIEIARNLGSWEFSEKALTRARDLIIQHEMSSIRWEAKWKDAATALRAKKQKASYWEMVMASWACVGDYCKIPFAAINNLCGVDTPAQDIAIVNAVGDGLWRFGKVFTIVYGFLYLFQMASARFTKRLHKEVLQIGNKQFVEVTPDMASVLKFSRPIKAQSFEGDEEVIYMDNRKFHTSFGPGRDKEDNPFFNAWGTREQLEGMPRPYATGGLVLPRGVRNNQFRVSLIKEGEKIKSMIGLGVVGGFALLPAHFFRHTGVDGESRIIVEQMEMVYERGKQKKHLCFDHKRLLHWVDDTGVLDLVGYDFGTTVECFADIRGHFVDYDKVDNACVVPALFSKFRQEDIPERAMMNLKRVYYNGQNNDAATAETYIGNYWSYSCKDYGDCGAILYSEKYGVMGMHTAVELPNRRHGGVGMAVRLSKKILQNFLDNCEIVVACSAPMVGVVSVEEKQFIGDSPKIGELEKPAFEPLKSQFRFLPYSKEEWASNDYLPAAMGENQKENRLIMKKSYAKLCRTVKHFPQWLVDEGVDSILDLFQTVEPFERPRLLTMVEVLNGGLPALAALDVKTSAGSQFKHLVSHNAPGKRSIIGAEKPYKIVSPEFQKRLEDNERMLRCGVQPDFLADYVLKSEMRSKKRVLVAEGEIPSSRGINVSPLDETMLMRKYFGHFINFMHSNYSRFEMCVGINVFSKDWNAMILDMLRVSPVGLAMDYSGHETNSTSQMFEAFGKVVEAYYERGFSCAEDRMMRKRLLYCVCYHRTRVGSDVFLKNEHLMSGSAITAIMNSFVTMLHFRIAFLVLGRGTREGASLSDFTKLVCLKVYGDDNIASISARIPWYNSRSIAACMQPFGIEMTMADKVTEVKDQLDSVLDLSFLKCSSRLAHGVIPGVEYFPVVEEASLIKSLMATSTKIDLVDIVYALGNDVLSRVWSAGLEPFKKWRARIWKVWKDLGILETPITYREVESRWIEGRVSEWAGMNVHMDWVTTPGVLHTIRVRATADVPLTPEVVVETTNMVDEVKNVAPMPVGSLDSVSKVLKRMTPIHKLAGPFEFNVCSVFYGPPFLSMPSAFQYYASMYYGFIGDLTFYVVLDDAASLVSAAYSGDDFVQNPNTSTYGTQMVMGPIARQRGSLLIRCPMLTSNLFVRMPLEAGDINTSMCSMGKLRIVGGAGMLYCALSDQSRFFGLRQIPRLLVVSNNYPHADGSEFTLTEYFTLIHAEGFELLPEVTQPWINSIQADITDVLPASGSAPCTQFKTKTSNFSDLQLRGLGQNIKVGQPRYYVPGNTVVSVSLAEFWSAPLSTTINASSGFVDRAQFNLKYSSYLSGSFYVIAGQRVLVADAVTINNYTSVDAKKVIGMPASLVYVRNSSPFTTGVLTERAVSSPWRYQVSSDPLWCLSALPPLEEEKKIKATATQFTGEVILHTAGGLPSGAKNVAVGGLIPEATTALPERPAILSTIQWSDTDLEGTILAMFENPFDLINQKSAKPAFDASIFWSGEAVLHLKTASNPAIGGQLLVFWVPGMRAARAAAYYGGKFASALLCAHVNIQPNSSGVVSFTAPFVHHKWAVRNSDPSDIIGTFVVMVQNRLRVGPNAVQNSVTLTCHGSFNNNKFSILNPLVVATGGFVSKAVTNNYNLSHVANAAIDASGARDDFKGGDSNISTNDRPFISLSAPSVLPLTYRNFASCEDVDFGARLDLEAADLPQVVSSITGAVTDEMSLRKMRETPSYIGRFQIQTADNVGDLLFKWDLCPGSEFFSVPGGGTVDPCLLTAASLGGTFWRGDIVLTFEFVSTVYHTVDVAVCSSYGVDTSLANIETATSQYTTNVHVAGPLTKATVVFPWTSDTPLKRVCNGNFTNSGDYSMGYATVRLLSPLQANELVADVIDCNVYMSMRGEVFFLGNSACDVVVAEVDVAQSFSLVGR